MSAASKLKHELRQLAVTWLYFVAWIGLLVMLKKLLLAEQQIEFKGLPVALMGALILAKVVMLMEYVPLGRWVGRQPAWVDVVVRTALYAMGVVGVLGLEKGFEGRHEYGGFGPAVSAAMQQTDAHHVWINAIVVNSALLGYNALSVVRQNLGKGGLTGLFLKPLPHETPAKHA
jgi:hypothetical protein